MCENNSSVFFSFSEANLPFLAQCVSQSKVIAESSHSADDGLINQTSQNKNARLLLFYSRPLVPICP